jgi:sulfur-carrier protein adenylyltransferase/sulfurtransferase
VSLSSQEEFSKEEKVRYSRHFLLPEVGEVGQSKLRAAHVLVVGAGGLGSPALLYLAAAGVGKLTVVDPDVISLSNLQRQVLFKSAEVGSSKSKAAQEQLQGLNPGVKVEPFCISLDESNVQSFVSSASVVVDCSDNFTTRYLLNDACVKWQKPLSYAAISRFEGQSAFFRNSPSDPCLRCLFPKPPAPGAVLNCSEAGVLGVLPGVFGLIQAKDVLRFLISGISSQKLTHWDLWTDEFHSFQLSKVPHCEVCSVVDKSALKVVADPGQLSSKDQYFSKGNQIQPKNAFAKLKSFFLLDVRLPEECKIVSLPNAVNIPLSELVSRANELPRNVSLLVYCKSGGRSQQACLELQKLGFEDTWNLEGGILKWHEDVDPSIPVY